MFNVQAQVQQQQQAGMSASVKDGVRAHEAHEEMTSYHFLQAAPAGQQLDRH
jgi:CTP:molybdopterin cytidylyltransferase MocA